jgi:hypothetical protein
LLVHDRLYGRTDVQDRVLLGILVSNAMNRLKGISQHGVPVGSWRFPTYSRYEHSVGVMLLLKRLDASLEEQAAGLLHDVSHTAFSHVADWVFGSTEREDLQDKLHSKFLPRNAEVCRILEDHGLDVKRISNLGNYSLLERPPPGLCADRIDYALRDLSYWVGPKLVKPTLDSLANVGNRIVFTSKRRAGIFARGYLRCQLQFWGSTESTVRYYLLSSALKHAVKNKIVLRSDFFTDDSTIIHKLNSAKDERIMHIMKLLAGHLKFARTRASTDMRLRKKFRYVDPLYLEDGKLVRLSRGDGLYRSRLEEARKTVKRRMHVSSI